MKHKGNTFEFMRERNRDLLRVYKEQALAMTFIDADILMERIVKCPAKRFWVSEERARRGSPDEGRNDGRHESDKQENVRRNLPENQIVNGRGHENVRGRYGCRVPTGT